MQNKYAVVSGAGKGIGKAIALTLAANGYTVIASARTQADLESMQAENANIIPFATDLSTIQGVDSLVRYIKQYCGTPAVIVNNLGIYAVDSMNDTNADVTAEQMQVNFWSTYRLTMPFVPYLIERRSGHIINISSVAAIEPVKYASSYCISKHAQLGFSRVLQADLKNFGVHVTTIIPGNVDTPSWNGYQGDRSNFLQPQEIADIALAELKAEKGEEIIIRNV